MATIDDLLNDAAVVRDEDQEQENTAFRVGTLLVNVIQYLSSLITSEDADAAISDALADFFVEGALKQSALPPAFMSSLSDWAEGVAEKESTTHLLKLIHSRIILLDSMGSTLDGLDYTPVAGDLVWRMGYVWKYNGSEYEDGGIPPKPHAVYVNKHTGKMYMWNGRAMAEVGNHYDDKIQISKMDETAIANIPAGKVHYVPSQSKLVYRISRDEWHSWTPRTDLIYIDISSNALYRWQGSSFQKVTSNSGSGGGAAVVSAFENYEAYESINALPGQGVAATGYIVGKHIYAYVNTGGDTKDGKYQDLGQLEAAGVSVTTTEDGTFTIHVGSDSYTVNLNHTHPNMCKLVVCEESDLPSTLDPATIYAITDSGETEIEKLIIKGMEFAGGGGTPSTDPRITSPIGTQIDFNGASTKTVTVRASNLSEALTIAVTGMTASLQTISANDAENGVQLTLTKDQNFASGTLRIYSSEVDKSWNAIDSQGLQLLTAIKLTGTQYFNTGYYPNANTKFELDVKFEKNSITESTSSANNCCVFASAKTTNSELFIFQTGYGTGQDANPYAFMVMTKTTAQIVQYVFGTENAFCQRGVMSYSPGAASFLNHNLTPPAKVETNSEPLMLGYGVGKVRPFDVFNMIVYGLKIYEGTTLLHDFVPARNNGVVGLYDQQTSAFIASASGTEPEIVTQ